MTEVVAVVVVVVVLVVVGVNQGYSRLSTTHGHITDCKLDSVVYAGVCVLSECGPVLFGPNDLRSTVAAAFVTILVAHIYCQVH